MPSVPPSKSAVKKAGSNLRKFRRGEITDPAVEQAAISTIEQHRAAHARPLVHANNGLRSMVRTAGCSGQVSQRLKRMATIIDKVEREPTLSLDKMQDIGGCRAVLASLEDVWRVHERLVKTHPEAKTSDYITTPRQSGYRGLHVIVEYGPGEPRRPIEIQLRSEVMHSWAMMVETYSGNTGTNYKTDGTSPFHLMARSVSEIFAHNEHGTEVPPELLDQYRAQYRAVFPAE